MFASATVAAVLTARPPASLAGEHRESVRRRASAAAFPKNSRLYTTSLILPPPHEAPPLHHLMRVELMMGYASPLIRRLHPIRTASTIMLDTPIEYSNYLGYFRDMLIIIAGPETDLIFLTL
jgi:hypothetical protein